MQYKQTIYIAVSLVLKHESVNSFKYFLQILQNLEFPDAKFLMCMITETFVFNSVY